ncbi:signal recognition particle-docking protein FtsY [Candidatus Woesearchaeota archaeon]|nr:signal recognition particle-docking protein FtsY [Candidatus Woesearchaeota archaeon]
MFGFLKNKLKGALNKFSKDVEEEVKEEAPEEKKEEVKEEKPKEEKVEVKKEEVKEKEVKEGAPEEEKKKEIKEEPKEESKEKEEKKEVVEEKKEERVVEKKEEVKKESEVEEKKEIPEEKPEPVEEQPKLEEKKHKVPKEEPKPEIKEKTPEEPEKKKGFFKRVTSKFTEKVTTTTLSEKKFDELFWELELALLENNVAVEVIEKIKNDLKKDLTENPIPRGKIQETVVYSLKKSISELFDVEQVDLLEKVKTKKPFVICFVGINGSGKTTTIAKVAHLLKKNNFSVILAAADTFRAAAIDQLQLHADNLGVKLIKHDYGSDAAAVAFDAVKHAESKNKDVVLIDTAGRLHSDSNLVEEMKKIVRISKPDMIVFVGESITGNDCTEQAQKFNEAVNLDGIILSKADIDEKGGAAISVSYVTKKPILYIGTGQEYDDLEKFNKEKLLASIGL